jgi:ubiquitin-activating enzyme E1
MVRICRRVFSRLFHYMLPRKRLSEGEVVVEEPINNSNSNSNSNNSGSVKKARMGESTVNESDKSFSSGGDNSNSTGNLIAASSMAFGNSNPQEIDEDLHSRQLAVYGRETMRRLFASSVLVSGMRGLGAEIGNKMIALLN